MDGPPANDWCSVCHGHFNVPCQANCSHWFCGDCIMMVWQHGSAIQPCKCPLCRRQITLLVPGEASLRQRHNPQVAEVLGKIETYNRLFGGRSNGLVQRLQDLPFLIRRLVREMMDPQRSLPLVIRARVYISVKLGIVKYRNWPGNETRLKLQDYLLVMKKCIIQQKLIWASYKLVSVLPSIMILSAIYVLSPVDLIPEGILGIFGLLDDFFIAVIAFLHVAAIYRSVLYYRHGGS